MRSKTGDLLRFLPIKATRSLHMKPEETTPHAFPAPLSRREFLAASMASVALAAFDRNALADANPGETRNLADASFEHAAQRAAELVNRMTLDEVTHQLVHDAP